MTSIDISVEDNTTAESKKVSKIEAEPEYHRRFKTGPHSRKDGWRTTQEIEAAKYDFWESVAKARRTNTS